MTQSQFGASKSVVSKVGYTHLFQYAKSIRNFAVYILVVVEHDFKSLETTDI